MGKKRIDKEFKIEAVRLASEPGNTQSGIERDLGISQGIISRWKRELFGCPYQGDFHEIQEALWQPEDHG